MKDKCRGSGQRQMLTWDPTPEPSVEMNGKQYPGAALCLHCSYGILVLRGSIKPAVSESGHEGLTGILRVHKRAIDYR